MRKKYRRQVAQYAKQNRRRSAWRKFVQAMACIVVFCTTYALILPAITLEQSYNCGLEAHTHEQSCYAAPTEQMLECTVPPEDTEHIHSEACGLETASEVLICTLVEHQHVDQCLSDPEADLETGENWADTLDHVSLTGNWAQDLAAIANTQIGYRESEKNYQVQADGARRGYSRYGAWYGIPYGKWDAMFAAFCMHYAQIPEETLPFDADSGTWYSLLHSAGLIRASEEGAAAGDLVFFADEEGTVNRVAIVTAAEEKLTVAEGDSGNRVLEHRVPVTGEGAPVGFISIASIQPSAAVSETEPTASTEVTVPAESVEATVPVEIAEPDEPTETTEPTEPAQQENIRLTAETENYIVTVTYSPDLEIPQGAALQVSEYPRDSEIFRQRCQEAGYELEWLLNIGFFLDGQEVQLTGTFDVVVTGKRGQSLGSDITHFSDEGNQHIDGTEAQGEGVTFSTNGFSDFGGGVATDEAGVSAAAAGDTVTGFQYVTANPNQLKENTDYVIYTGNGTAYNFMSASKTSVQITGSDSNSPYQVGRTWSVNAATMGTTAVNDMSWRVVKSGTSYYLRSQNTGTFLKLNNGWSSMERQGNASRLRNSNVNGASVRVGDGTYHIRYENNEWKSTWTNNSGYWTEPTTIYFAEVTPVYASTGNYPDAVYTGDVHVDRLRFYNLCEDSESGVTALAGCVFRVEGTTATGQRYNTTIVSDDSPQIALPSNIPDGKYTITEVSAPEGYMRDLNNVREFWIENGALVSEHNVGTFLNHSLEQLTAGKSGEVEDYNNRIYQILLNAKTNLSMYHMDPIEVLFVVDKSNSMLFPSGMEPTGKSITLRTNDGNNVNNNLSVLNSLDKSVMHYIIADPNGTATVYAIWHDGTAWLYQDASYYAKAKFDNGTGYESAGETVIFPGDRGYSEQSDWEDSTYGTEYRSNGGGLNRDMTGSTLGNFINNSGGSCTFALYTAKDPYNRLHYLEEALANMIYELADANHENQVTLIPFTKEVQTQIYYPLGTNNVVSQPVTLTTSNAEMLFDIVTHIDTSGGTRQDLALEYAYETYLDETDGFDRAHTYTILITDGAPVRSGSSAPPLGTPDSNPTTADDGEIYGRIKGWGAKVREESTLMTVALGMEYVEGGKRVLQQIASDDEFYCALDDASALTESMQRILFDGMKNQGELLVDESLIVDEISDSFYPIAWTDPANENQTDRMVLTQSNGKTWLLLQAGDWITLDGAFTTQGAADAAGQLLQKDDGTYYIQWQNQVVSGTGWNGTFYVKAKEDFIGGNAIDTNKAASVTVHDASKTMETPTVNVRLLDLNEQSSEVTVYLGDTVNGDGSSPISLLREYYQDICFTKLISDGGTVLNKVAAADDNGLEEGVFYLKYAIGRDLTDDEWTALMDGESLTFPYTYDDPSSHGAVGEFTITLTRTGTSSDYAEHAADQACHPDGQPPVDSCENPAEVYTLSVVYEAHRLGQDGRPDENVHNSPGIPGTEVGTGSTLPTGLGRVDSINAHEVHVISGSIVIRKVIEESLVSDAAQTFTFTLHRMEDGEDTSRDVTRTITVPAGSTQSSANITFSNLARGTYIVTEAVSDDYALKQITVASATNCESTPSIGESATEVTFVMGNNVGGWNVIGKTAPSERFTSYVDPVNGVYGEAVFTNAPRVYTGEIPVQKQWDDGADIHTTDSVYLLLLKDGIPVLDSEGRARLLRLDNANHWQGAFTVVLADKYDKVSNHDYAIREVSAVSNENLYTWSPAVLENDGTTLLYYEKALEDGQLGAFGGRSYVVRYEEGADESWTVTNLHAVELPMTGGTGTSFHTFGGLALIAFALMYICITGRKRRKEAN